MIGVKLCGGLGNQLFQYGFGCYLAKKRRTCMFFFTDKIEDNNRFYDILEFPVKINFLSQKELMDFRYSFGSKLTYRLKRKFISLIPILNKNVLVEKKLSFLTSIPDSKKIFDGYWQCYKYINSVETKLRNEIVFDQSLVVDSLLYDEIYKNNSVSVHVRRGDYLSDKNSLIYEECGLPYYKESIRYMLNYVDNPIFYIFSNDISWAKELFSELKDVNIKYVDNSLLDKSVILDMFLMSISKHQIIANSTFSWWGAWLNQNPNKIVIAPKKWYQGELNKTTNDLVPPDWIRL